MSLKNRKALNQRLFQYVIFCLLVLCIALIATPATSRPNFYETREIKKKIVEHFNELIDIWSEELYFEMYQYGTTRSRKRLNKIEFVQRLVDLHWKPSLKPIKDVEIKILYRNVAIIEFTQEFVNKFDQTRTVEKRMIFPTIMEGANWKFDLTQLINIPYEGRIPEEKPKKVKVEVKEAPKEATSDATPDTAP